MLRKLLRFTLYFFITIILLSGLAVWVVYSYKDVFIQLFVNEANKRLDAKVIVDKIDVEFWKTFPYFSLDLKNVRIIEAVEGSDSVFARAENLYISLSFKDLLEKRYMIKKLYVRNGELNFKVFKNGEDNFSIIKASEDTSNQLIVFNLSDIKIEKVRIRYEDMAYENTYDVFLKRVSADFHLRNEDWDIDLKGDIRSNVIKLHQLEFFKDKAAHVDSKIVYSRNNHRYEILPSTISILNAEFKLAGELSYAKKPYVNIKFSEQHSDFQTIISLLPNKVSESFVKYRSNGNIYFNGLVKGNFTSGHKPLLKVTFGCKNVSFYHPESQEGVTGASFTGEYNNGRDKGESNSFFELKDIKAIIQKKELKGNFLLRNFQDPYIKLDVNTSLNAAHILKNFPIEQIEKASGDLLIDIKFEGKKSDVKNKNYSALSSEGKIEFKEITIKLKKEPLDFKNCNGTLLFNKTDLNTNNFICTVGNSDFTFNGVLKNIIPYVLYKNEPLEVVADVKSDFLDVDQLLSSETSGEINTSSKSSGTSSNKDSYKLTFSPTLAFDLNCKIKRLKFKRFYPSNIEGRIALRDQEFTSDNIKMNIADGSINLHGKVRQRRDTSFLVAGTCNISTLDIDSMFYMTENFGQNFMTYKHLKGKLTADVKTAFEFDKNLKINTKTLLSQIKMSIKDGQLINFQPMQSLSRFVDEDALANIKFSELKNDFLISNQTILIPEMTIKTNITTMSIMGSHTFDNYFEYKLKIPLKNYKKKGLPDEDNAIEGNVFNGFYLYLTIIGTPDKYKIAYDKSAVKQKIKERWQEEKKEFKELFKKDYQKKQLEKGKVLELNEEEYMDF